MAGIGIKEPRCYSRSGLLLAIVSGLVALVGCIPESPGVGFSEQSGTSGMRPVDVGGFLFGYDESGGDELLLSRAQQCRERLDGRINGLFTNDILKARSSGESSRSIFIMIARTSSNNLEIREVHISGSSARWVRLTNEHISAALFGDKLEGGGVEVTPIEGELGPDEVSQLLVPISSLALMPRESGARTTKQTCYFIRILDGMRSSNVLIMSETEEVSSQHGYAESYEGFLDNVLRLTQ